MFYIPPEVDLGNEEIILSKRKRFDTSDSLWGYNIGISTPESVSSELLDQYTSLYTLFLWLSDNFSFAKTYAANYQLVTWLCKRYGQSESVVKQFSYMFSRVGGFSV